MDDGKIIDLYWMRSETAITETADKYGRYCHGIARGILQSREDAEECVSDTYMRAWNAMPPKRPDCLKTFLGRITRNLSLNRLEQKTARKRAGGQLPLVLDELAECIPDGVSAEQTAEDAAVAALLDRFLDGLAPDVRRIFVRRYWYMHSIRQIAKGYGITESRVKVTLYRTREKLKAALAKEGILL